VEFIYCNDTNILQFHIAVPQYERLDVPMYKVEFLWYTGAVLASCPSWPDETQSDAMDSREWREMNVGN